MPNQKISASLPLPMLAAKEYGFGKSFCFSGLKLSAIVFRDRGISSLKSLKKG